MRVFLFFLLLVASVVDGLLTQTMLDGVGYAEFNPIMRFAMKWDGGMWIMKGCCMDVVASFLKHLSIGVLSLVCGCMVSVATWNLYLYLR